MSAQIIQFPIVRVEREEPGVWLVVARDHGWLHGDRQQANSEAIDIARGFGIPARTAAS